MKILFFVQESFTQLTKGFALRTYNLCKNLKKNGHELFLIHFDIKNNCNSLIKNEGYLEEEIEVQYPNFLNTFFGKSYKILMAFPASSRIKIKPNQIKNIHKKLEKIIKKNKIDLIHIANPEVCLILKGFNLVPKVFSLADAHYLAIKRKMKYETKIKKLITNQVLLYYSKGLEKTLIKNSDVTTLVSSIDKKAIDKLCAVRTVVIPNGVDTDYFSPSSIQETKSQSIIFHGNMSFPPNIRAVRYIVREIFPIIRSKMPKSEFLIVGGNPTEEIIKLGEKDGITVTGYVKDIRKYLNEAIVGLYPMIIGSGIKNKILEAMSMSLPIVTNRMGAEALSQNAKNCINIGEQPNELADYVIKILRDEKQGQYLGKKSREIVKKDYNWKNVTKRYEDIYNSLI